jgi:NodT family efflux transporter outer membrane factor (OMF) lipoprotein
MVESRLYPTLGISAGAFATRGSENGFGFPYGIPGKYSNLFQAGFDATYEVDLFGGIRRSVEAAGDLAEAVEDERRSVQVTLLGEVARNYIALRTLQRRLVVARANLDDQLRTAGIVQRRFDNGLAPNFDVVRARAQVVATESAIPPLEAGARQRIHALSVLMGEEPLALSDELASEAPIPPVPPEVPIGLPSELLRRRPDVRRAERLLAAATAEQGVATADLFPHLVLGATAGVQSRHLDNLFRDNTPGSGFYVAGPAAQWTLFDGGRRTANIDRTKARVAAAASEYEATVLGSLRDVESALTSYAHDQTRRSALTALVAENQEAVRIARGEYDQGIVALLDVIEVQRNLYSAEDALAQADQAVSSNLVALYKALGGGWEAVEAGATGASAPPQPGPNRSADPAPPTLSRAENGR